MTLTAGSELSSDAHSKSFKSRIEESVDPQDLGKPLRILHVINDLSTGGAEMMLYRLLTRNDRLRFEPVIISLMDQGPLGQRIKDLGIAVYSPRMRRGLPSPASIFRLVRLIREIKPDLIQGWLYHGSLAGQLGALASSKPIPVIWSIHCSIYSLAFEKRLTALVVRICAVISRMAAAIIFVSRTSQTQHENLGYKIEKSFVVPNGIDVNEFAPSQDAKLAVRVELALPSDATLVGNISRFHPMKDHVNFLRAAARIVEGFPEVHFLLAGRDLDANNRVLMQLIRELNLNDRVHLLGERTDIARLVAALNLFCLSSAYGESFPLIVGEAMASAVPCVVTDVGDSAWMLNSTGRVVPPRDSEALAAACVELLELGQSDGEALGHAARNRVIELFSLDTIVSEYEVLYETTAANAALKNRAPAIRMDAGVSG